MKSWTSGIRRIVVGILLLCYLYCQKAMAEPLPWPLQAPEANRTYLAILPVMHQGSQSECNEEYFLLNRICDNVIIKREGELADWDGDYNETYIAKLEAELKRAKEREEQFRLDEMSEA